jgi:hypothetical protein
VDCAIIKATKARVRECKDLVWIESSDGTRMYAIDEVVYHIHPILLGISKSAIVNG